MVFFFSFFLFFPTSVTFLLGNDHSSTIPTPEQDSMYGHLLFRFKKFYFYRFGLVNLYLLSPLVLILFWYVNLYLLSPLVLILFW